MAQVTERITNMSRMFSQTEQTVSLSIVLKGSNDSQNDSSKDSLEIAEKIAER